MKNKTKDKLEMIVEITKNIPGAVIELGSVISCAGGALVSTVGTAIAYLSGDYELAKNFFTYGGVVAAVSLVSGGVMVTTRDELSLLNIADAVNNYKLKKEGKIDLETLKHRYPKRNYD